MTIGEFRRDAKCLLLQLNLTEWQAEQVIMAIEAGLRTRTHESLLDGTAHDATCVLASLIGNRVRDIL